MSSSFASNREVAQLISYQDMIMHGQGAKELFVRHSPEVMRKVSKYISNPSNKETLATPEGARLLENHQKIVNFNTLKSNLENCVSEDEDDLMLKNRLIDAAGNSFSLPVPCRRDITKFNELDDFMKSILKPTSKMIEESFEEDLANRALLTAIETLIKVKYKYDQNFMTNEKLSKRELNSLVSKMCKSSKKCESSKYKEELQSKIQLMAQKVSSTEKKKDHETIVSDLNGKISNINSSLRKISFKAKERWYWTDYADMEDPSKKAMFQNYLNTYLKESSNGDGALLLTDSYKDSSGALKSYSDDSDNIKQVGSRFIFKSHRKMTKYKLAKSITEVKRKVNEQISSLNNYNKEREDEKSLLTPNVSSRRSQILQGYKKRKYSQNRKETIKDLIKRNPVAAGQTLLSNPAYSDLACSSIKEITQEKRDDDETHKTAVLLGAIGGGLLIATGVGAVAGGWLLTGSLTAGIAAGTVGGTVLGATTTGALILGGAESAYFTNKAHTDYTNSVALDRAILAGSSDETSIEESRDEMIAFKEARFDAALALGFTAVDLGAMKGISKLASSSKNAIVTLSGSQRRNLKNIYSEINDPKSMSTIKDAISKMGPKGARDFDQFLGILSTSNGKWQREFLKQLENGELSASTLKKLGKETIEAAKHCK